MCNPPFFTSKADMDATHLNKKGPPSAVCTGADVEMIYEDGGDLGFVMRILEESCQLRTKIQWYSSMFGKLSSAAGFVEILKERSINNFAVTALQAGSTTRRWVVAWSFLELRPRNVSSKFMHPLNRKPVDLISIPSDMLMKAGCGTQRH
jgi:23S rRNA (adenine1618-N6)-methyltransferase